MEITATVVDAAGHTVSASTSVVVAGVDTAALLAGVQTTVTSNVTHATPGQSFSHVDFNGARVSNTTTDTLYEDCIFRGDNSVNALFTSSNINAKRITMRRCWFIPKFMPGEKNAISGHDIDFENVLIEGTTDGIQIQNGSQFAATGAGWATGMKGRRFVIRRLARLTSATKSLAGNNDTVTHNDGVQQLGGVGTDLEEFVIDARPGLQRGHFVLRSAAGHVYTEAEAWALPDEGPFLLVPLGSLPDGGPFASPYLDATHPARPLPWVSNGTGLFSQGEISRTDWSCLMVNNTQGSSSGFRLVKGVFYGAEVPINNGGNPYATGLIWGTMEQCRFDRSQGLQGHTIDLSGNWAGHATIPTTGPTANTHLDGGALTVRF